MVYDIFEILKSYVSDNPTFALGVVAVFIALNSLVLARRQRDRVRFENLEKESVFQISENLKDIERILSQNIGVGADYSLQNILDGKIKPQKTPELERQLSVLARYFSEFPAILTSTTLISIQGKNLVLTFRSMGIKLESTIACLNTMDTKTLV